MISNMKALISVRQEGRFGEVRVGLCSDRLLCGASLRNNPLVVNCVCFIAPSSRTNYYEHLEENNKCLASLFAEIDKFYVMWKFASK